MGQSCLVGWWSVETADVKIWVVFVCNVCPNKFSLMEFLIAMSTPTTLEDRSFL